MAGLPADARCRKEDPTQPEWGDVEELLAQLIEEVSVLAADYRRKEPLVIPRPWGTPAAAEPTPGVSGGVQSTPDGGTVATGLTGMLALAAAGRVRMTPPAATSE